MTEHRVSEDDTQRTPAHLLDTVLHDQTHALRHVERVREEPDEAIFNAEHAEKHLRSAHEHAHKLARHLEAHDVDSSAFAGEADTLGSIGKRATKLWVDDDRPAPDGWTWARDVKTAVQELERGGTTEISLDYDLWGQGDGTYESGMEVVEWMVANKAIPETVRIHSDNPDGAKKMATALRKAGAKPIVQVYDGDEGQRSASPEPPNYRPEDTPDERCGNCRMYDQGLCWGYGNKRVEANYVCDSWAPESEAQQGDGRMAESDLEQRRDFSDAERKKLAKEGKALPDGSYPIVNTSDLKNAIQAVGRASDPGAAKAHIKKRAKALGATNLLPEDWRALQEIHSCEDCDGTGRDGDGPCEGCDGTGEAGGPPEVLGAQDDLERRARHAQEREGMMEHRAISDFEVRDTSDGIVRFSGYASSTETPYDIADFTETIARGAFKRTLGESPDVRLVVNHGVGGQLPLARTKSGTLALSEDARGLKVDADLDPNDPDVKALLPKMRRGDVDEMSFAFRATEQDWSEDYTQRTIRAVSLHKGDVSIVTVGANHDTNAVIRSDSGELELRAGKTISQATGDALKTILNRFETIDDESDKGQEEVASILGVANPDEDAERSPEDTYKFKVQPRRSLDLEAAKVRLARARGER